MQNGQCVCAIFFVIEEKFKFEKKKYLKIIDPY